MKNNVYNEGKMPFTCHFTFARVTMRERNYQTQLIKKLRILFPGCMILRNNPNDVQGIPDLLILFKDRWAALEAKISKDAPDRPNQRHYIEQMADMSFAAFISPENETEVLDELQFAFLDCRSTRFS